MHSRYTHSCRRRSAIAPFIFCQVLLLAATANATDQDLSVPLPPGETFLADIGMYRVFWQSGNNPPVSMPISWSGHFEPTAGISYQDWGRVLDRRALLLHSPWHVPPGKTWVDYELALPNLTPIRLKFGIAMGPDVARPDRSDGVTFSCFLTVDGREAGTVAPASRRGPLAGLRFRFDALRRQDGCPSLAGRTGTEEQLLVRLLVLRRRSNHRSARGRQAIGNPAAIDRNPSLQGRSPGGLDQAGQPRRPRRPARQSPAVPKWLGAVGKRLAIHLRRGRLPRGLRLDARNRHAGRLPRPGR